MKKIAIVFHCCLLISITTFTQSRIVYFKPADSLFKSHVLTKEDLKQDLQFWNMVMEESHVQLYHAISKDNMQRLQDSLLNTLPGKITHEQALHVMGIFAGSLNEGHIFLPISSIVDSLYAKNAIRFPFAIQSIVDGKFVIQANWSGNQQLTTGDTITSINGISTKAIYNRLRNYYGGLEGWREQMVATYLRKLMFINNFQSPYTINAIKQNGNHITLSVKGLNSFEVDSINKSSNQQSQIARPPFELSVNSENIAIMMFNSMNRSLADSFNNFLANSFSKIRDLQCKGLVIDLRENSGGDSKLGLNLINYISSKSYRLAAGMKWKVSEHYKKFLQLVQSDEVDYFKKANGQMIEYRESKLTKPRNNQLTYHGKVAVLIGPRTFSSANMLADGIKEYKLAKIFGEAAGESGNDFGEIFEFMLPNTHIVARATTKMFIRASGNENDFSPTQPDIFVKSLHEHSLNDTVIKSAVDWILNKSNN